MSDIRTLRVDLAGRGYDIAIGPGLIDRAGELSAKLLARPRVIIVSDDIVAERYGARVYNSFKNAGISASILFVPAGERSKEFETFGQLMNALLDQRPDRGTTLVALGGGVVGDLVGFAASVLLRGVDFIQLPTTLLAQVDSSVGGKTGINTRHGKNLVGAFYQPRLVLADTDVLDTLPRRELLAGYAEVVKYGLIDNPAFFDWCEQNAANLLDGDAAKRTYAIEQSCRAKARIVAADERETGQRALLNLGHTFGHALEAATGFSDRLFHGEGVAIGMTLAAQFSAKLGMIGEADAARVERHLVEAGLPTRLQDIAGFSQEGLADADALMALMAQDKKVKRGKLTFILLEAVGRAVIATNVEPTPVRDFLQAKLAGN